MQAYEEEYRISWFVLIPVKMFWVLGEDHNPSFEYTPWCLLLRIQVITQLFKKCIIHWGHNKRPIITYTFSFGGYFLEKMCPHFCRSDVTQNVWKLFSITFNPFAIATVWAVVGRWVGGDVSPSSFSFQICRNCFGPFKIFQTGFSELHVCKNNFKMISFALCIHNGHLTLVSDSSQLTISQKFISVKGINCWQKNWNLFRSMITKTMMIMILMFQE